MYGRNGGKDSGNIRYKRFHHKKQYCQNYTTPTPSERHAHTVTQGYGYTGWKQDGRWVVEMWRQETNSTCFPSLKSLYYYWSLINLIYLNGYCTNNKQGVLGICTWATIPGTLLYALYRYSSVSDDIPNISDPTKHSYHNSMYRNGTATHACLAWCVL